MTTAQTILEQSRCTFIFSDLFWDAPVLFGNRTVSAQFRALLRSGSPNNTCSTDAKEGGVLLEGSSKYKWHVRNSNWVLQYEWYRWLTCMENEWGGPSEGICERKLATRSNGKERNWPTRNSEKRRGNGISSFYDNCDWQICIFSQKKGRLWKLREGILALILPKQIFLLTILGFFYCFCICFPVRVWGALTGWMETTEKSLQLADLTFVWKIRICVQWHDIGGFAYSRMQSDNKNKVLQTIFIIYM